MLLDNLQRHNICVFGVGDLPFMVSRPQFFANKFMASVDPFAKSCMRQYLAKKVHLDNKI